jgi:5'-3' exonuclease
MSIYC